MLEGARLALRIKTNAYDAEIVSLLQAGALDLTSAGVKLPGEVIFSENDGAIQDESTLTDPLCLRALYTYVRMNFGSPDDYERLRESYRNQKILLMHAGGYTEYGGE